MIEGNTRSTKLLITLYTLHSTQGVEGWEKKQLKTADLPRASGQVVGE